MALLARWARQQSLQPPQTRQHALLSRAATAAKRLLEPAAAPPRASGPQVAAACVLVLGSVAAAAAGPAVAEDAAGAVGTALLGGQLGIAHVSAASDVAAAVASLLFHLLVSMPVPAAFPALLPSFNPGAPINAAHQQHHCAVAPAWPGQGSFFWCLCDPARLPQGKPEAAGWLLGALLQWLSTCVQGAGAGHAALDSLAPTYSMMRAAALSTLSRVGPAAAIHGLLQPAYSVLKTAAAAAAAMPPGGEGAATAQPSSELDTAAAAHASAAVLGLSGLAEGLLRTAGGYAEAAQLAADAEAGLVAACNAAAVPLAAVGTTAQRPAQPEPGEAAARKGAGQAGAAQLLCDACSLAALQLAAAVRRPAAAPSVARCQALSLLRRTLALAPLCDAAAAQAPPADASQMLQRQAGDVLAQQAGALARTLAEQLPLLDAPTQQWVLQEVLAAALEAHRLYRRYALETPAAWLSAVDAAAVRQLLDRLFLSCLVLLAAAWQAAPPHSQRAQRSQLAAAVLVALADLQFCRVASPQHAALLTAVLAEAPGDAAGAAALAASLPCYAELAASCRMQGGQPVWLVDSVTAAKVQLLMLALVPCTAALPQVGLPACCRCFVAEIPSACSPVLAVQRAQCEECLGLER